MTRLLHLNGPPGIGKSTLARRYVDDHPGTAYLRAGHDVVLPQMLISLPELEKFELAADEAQAEFVACMLTDTETAAVSRFYRRGEGDSEIAWHHQVREIVEAEGGDDALTACHRGLQELLRSRPGTAVVHSVEGEIDATYRSLLDTVS